MLRVELHQCPQCEGVIDRQHFAQVEFVDRVDEHLYCDFCGRGWEVSRYRDGDFFVLDFNERTEPINFGKFLQRLEDARVA